MEETEKIWMNGELVDWADAKVHVGVHGLHYGSGVFEGIRCYETPKGPAVFRLADHMQRLARLGAIAVHGHPVFGRGAARRRRTTWCAPTGSPARYVRPIALYGYGQLGVSHAGKPRENGDHELAVGRLPRRERVGAGNHAASLVLEPGRPRTRSRTRRRRAAST